MSSSTVNTLLYERELPDGRVAMNTADCLVMTQDTANPLDTCWLSTGRFLGGSAAESERCLWCNSPPAFISLRHLQPRAELPHISFCPVHIDIQIAIPEDAEAIYHVQRQTWLATYPNAALGITRWDIEAKFPLAADAAEAIERKRLLLQAQSAGAREWIAKDAGVVVGWAVGLKIKEDKHELAALYVLPDYQGKRVGGKLITAALEWLGDSHEITVSVATYNRNAISFYKRWGFRSLGPDPDADSILPSGAIIPSLKMVWPAKS